MVSGKTLEIKRIRRTTCFHFVSIFGVTYYSKTVAFHSCRIRAESFSSPLCSLR